jgi:GNAT superfamily N-acetyltransferase
MEEITIVEGYIPGAIGRVAELHGVYYHRHWGFGLFFEAMVASELAGFLSRFDPGRDGFWVLVRDERVMGGVAIDGTKAHERGAHLRWFIVAEHWQGDGWGGQLLDRALAFCRSCGYPRVTLWTFAGLDSARRLYEKAGFVLAEQNQGHRWGTAVTEQRFELAL